jgi:adenosylcobyric acid synthase
MKAPFQVLVLGTGSHAGKSLIATGLCRLLADRGWKTAPFKAQNMALNSAVADDGSEIGRAQWLQALAARTRSDARMNPILLKPVSGIGSQWIVLGKARGVLSTREYFRRWSVSRKAAQTAWAGLASEFDALVLEGAGSPAEVNLQKRDLANLETARFSKAPFVLVADIERGGSFAAIQGTLELIPAWLRQRCLGVILNKFRGDKGLLVSAGPWMKRRGTKLLGILPWQENLILEQEDSLGKPCENALGYDEKALLVDVISSRALANYNDILPLEGHPGIQIRWVQPGQKRSIADLVILPGSKNTLADLRRIKLSGEAQRLEEWCRQGTWILGICGGFQMMGFEVRDSLGIDSGVKGGRERGLGCLALTTRMAKEKVLARRRQRAQTSIGRLDISGYEIHHGRTEVGEGVRVEVQGPAGEALMVSGGGGRYWGTYLHGILDDSSFRNRFLAQVARDRGKRWEANGASLAQRREDSLKAWAGHMERHLDLSFLPPRRQA